MQVTNAKNSTTVNGPCEITITLRVLAHDTIYNIEQGVTQLTPKAIRELQDLTTDTWNLFIH